MSSSASSAPLRVDADDLRSVTAEILSAAGLDAGSARAVADGLVAADLRGVESHGVSNLLRQYVAWIDGGEVNPRPALALVRESAATAVYDTDGGLGLASGPLIMQDVIDRARKFGIGFATAINGRHLGMLAYTAMLALRAEMIGICATAGGPRLVPTFGREARLGTNPIAVAAPARTKPPFVFDAATTVVPVNKVLNAVRRGRTLPPGHVIQSDGCPTADHRVPRMEDCLHLAPLGSFAAMGSHKGYGLAGMVDILCNLLPGAPYGYRSGHGRFGHMFVAVNIAAFTEPEEFKSEMDDFLKMLNETPPARDIQQVRYAGQAEWETQQERQRRGVPLDPEVLLWFHAHCARVNVDASRLPLGQ